MEATLEDLLVSIGLNATSLAAFGKSVSQVVQKTAEENPVKVRIEPLRDAKGQYINKEDTAAVAAREAEIKAIELINEEHAARMKVADAIDVQKAQTVDFFNSLISGAAKAAVFLTSLGNSIKEFFHKAQEEAKADEVATARLKVVFKDLTDDAEEFVSTTLKLNDALAGSQVTDAIARFQIIGETFLKSKASAFDMSKQMVTLASDLSVAFNKDFTEVMDDLTKSLVRGGRAARQYGIELTDTRINSEALKLGFEKDVETMNDVEEAQTKMNIIIADGKKVLGEYANSMQEGGTKSKTFAQVQKELNTQWDELHGSVGKFLNEAAIPLLQWLTKAVKAMKEYVEAHPETIKNLILVGKAIIVFGGLLTWLTTKMLLLKGASLLTGESMASFGGSLVTAGTRVSGFYALLAPLVDLIGIGMATALLAVAAAAAGFWAGWKVGEAVDEMTGLSQSMAEASEKARILAERLEALKKAGGKIDDVKDLGANSSRRIDDIFKPSETTDSGGNTRVNDHKDLIAFAKDEEKYKIATYRAEIQKTATSIDQAADRVRIFNEVVEAGGSAIEAKNQALYEDNRLIYLNELGTSRNTSQQAEWKKKYDESTAAMKDRLKAIAENSAAEKFAADHAAEIAAKEAKEEEDAAKAEAAARRQRAVDKKAEALAEEMDSKFKLKLLNDRRALEDQMFAAQKKKRADQIGEAAAEQEFASAQDKRIRDRELHPVEDLSKLKPVERDAKLKAGVVDAATIDPGNERDMIAKYKVQLAAQQEVITKEKERRSAYETARLAANAANTALLDYADKEKGTMEGEIAIIQRRTELKLENAKSDGEEVMIKQQMVEEIALKQMEKDKEVRDAAKKAIEDTQDAETSYQESVAKTTDTLADDLAMLDKRKAKELDLSKSVEQSNAIEMKYLIAKKRLIEETEAKEKEAADRRKKDLAGFAEAAKNQADKNAGKGGEVAIREASKTLRGQVGNVRSKEDAKVFNEAVDDTYNNTLKEERDQVKNLTKDADQAEEDFKKTKKAGGFRNSADRKKAQADVEDKRKKADEEAAKLKKNEADAKTEADAIKREAADQFKDVPDNFIGPLTEGQQRTRDEKREKKLRDDVKKKAKDAGVGNKPDAADELRIGANPNAKSTLGDLAKSLNGGDKDKDKGTTNFESAAKGLADMTTGVSSIAESQKAFFSSLENFTTVAVGKFGEINKGFMDMNVKLDAVSKQLAAMPVTGNNQDHEAERNGAHP